MFDVIKQMLISEKEFTENNYKQLQKDLICIKNNLINSDGGIYLRLFDRKKSHNSRFK